MDGFIEPFPLFVLFVRFGHSLTHSLTLSPSCMLLNSNFPFSSLLSSSLSDLKIRVERKKASERIPDIK